MPHDVAMNHSSIRRRMMNDGEGELHRVMERVRSHGDPAVWIHRLSGDEVQAQWKTALSQAEAGAATPLLGVPFAVKDNIDVAGLPTTAACPAYAYIASHTATCVRRLLDAGAILIGKTNLDQFATGLVGTRSPYGACRNAFDDRYISGGSSSGSAIAVAAGLVSFALGTDTAGSGRIPAAFNNIVGMKPTRGHVSAHGVVPACRSLDCVSIFALTCEDAARVLAVIAGHDEKDSYSRAAPFNAGIAQLPNPFRFGVPRGWLEFFGNAQYARLYEAAVERAQSLGGIAVDIDYEPFARAAALLYGGPWVAERYAAIADFIRGQPESLFPVTRTIIGKATKFNAVETFEAMYELARLKALADRVWRRIDVMLLPTAGTIYTLNEVEAQPYQTNTNLGCYTNFVNLLDYAALAAPAGITTAGLPFGVTLIAPAWGDAMLAELGQRMQAAAKLTMGATGVAMPAPEENRVVSASPAPGFIRLAVVGAHLSGQPLNGQLTRRGGTLVRTCRTAPLYRFYALTCTTPLKPGLVRVADGARGHAIEVELWDLPAETFGSFVNDIPSPLGIGTLSLDDGSTVKGFLCEPHGVQGATEISHLGGWRAYMASIEKE